MDQISLDRALAYFWLGAEALKALEDMDHELDAMSSDATQGWGQALKALDRARILLVDAARKDFRLGGSSQPEK